MDRSETLNKRKKRLKQRSDCKTDCNEMIDLKDQWTAFIEAYKITKRWNIGIIATILLFIFAYTIEAYSTSRNSVKIEDLGEYVKTEEMISFLLLEMQYVKKIIIMDKADVSDDVINDVFENHKWVLEQFMEYNPRSINPKPNYSEILKEYKKNRVNE